jgi:hypothetical protein
MFDVLPQNPDAKTVKSRNQRRRLQTATSQQIFYTLAHLTRGFVRKRNGENVIRRNAFFGDEISDANRDDACFTGTRAGENQKSAFGILDGFALLRI